MKRLLLLRHAKAVQGGSKTGDFERSLNERGEHDAPRMGAIMQHRRYIPDLALCSTSKRTMETWEHVALELSNKPEVNFSGELYLASAKLIANIVRSIRWPASAVLIVGHNPGLEECARTLARKPRSEEERGNSERLLEKFPTAALAVLDFEVEAWSDIEAGAGRLVDFLRPKELTSG
jgi:phosphohistidine phosphatase